MASQETAAEPPHRGSLYLLSFLRVRVAIRRLKGGWERARGSGAGPPSVSDWLIRVEWVKGEGAGPGEALAVVSLTDWAAAAISSASRCFVSLQMWPTGGPPERVSVEPPARSAPDLKDGILLLL